MYENPDTVAAVIVEPVTGTNGLIYPPDGYLASLREVCDRHGILLIFDEVMSGFGRTGEWFACDHWDVIPDILCVAKGLNSGYVPLGAMVVSEPIARWLDDHLFSGGMTYVGAPAGVRHGRRVDQGVPRRRRGGTVGPLGPACSAPASTSSPSATRASARCAAVACSTASSWSSDRATREPLVPFNAVGPAAAPMGAVVAAAKKQGLYLSANNNVLRLTPPLVIGPEDIDLALGILDDVLTLADDAAAAS